MDPFDDDIDDLISSLPGNLRSGVPLPSIQIQGNHTIVRNFEVIIKDLQRDPEHVKKFLAKILGVQIRTKNRQVILMSILQKSHIEGAFAKYIDQFVLCPNCNKPDTLLETTKKGHKLVCLACGHQYLQ